MVVVLPVSAPEPDERPVVSGSALEARGGVILCVCDCVCKVQTLVALGGFWVGFFLTRPASLYGFPLRCSVPD